MTARNDHELPLHLFVFEPALLWLLLDHNSALTTCSNANWWNQFWQARALIICNTVKQCAGSWSDPWNHLLNDCCFWFQFTFFKRRRFVPDTSLLLSAMFQPPDPLSPFPIFTHLSLCPGEQLRWDAVFGPLITQFLLRRSCSILTVNVRLTLQRNCACS